MGPTFQSVILPAAKPLDGLDLPAGRREIHPPDSFNWLIGGLPW